MDFPLPGEQTQSSESRLQELTLWVRGLPDFGLATLTPASVDASFRRYFRVQPEQAPAATWIAMDAPPPMEDCRPFLAVAGWLKTMSLNVPDILAADLDRGFILMSDMGQHTYLDVLQSDPDRIASLYDDALDALLSLQQRGVIYQHKLPAYNRKLLATELELFRAWMCERHLNLTLSADEQAGWSRACDFLVNSALSQPTVFVHRDFHSRNLMAMETGNPGILDFQDAAEGPLTYDLVSLLKDCYIRLDDARVRAGVERFYAGLESRIKSGGNSETFWTHFELMGVHRHLKAAGIFARLLQRDGKSGYMKDVPLVLEYIREAAIRHAELAPLAALISDRCLPALERVALSARPDIK